MNGDGERPRFTTTAWHSMTNERLNSWRGDIFLGIIGALICGIGMWIPSPWIDEAATAHITSHSLSEMMNLWRTVDANFAPYYVFMHVWTGLTGVNPFWLRLPSTVAAGVGVAAMASTGRLLGGPRHQVAYAACFALLPRTTAMALEARPYELSAMFTALALLLVARQVRALDSRWNPLLLAAAMVGAVGMHLFSALPIIGMVAGTLGWLRPPQRLRLLISSVAAGLLSLPLAIVGRSQQEQIAWLADVEYSLLDQALVESWFTSRWNINPVSATRSPYLHDVPLHWVAVVVAGLSLLVIIAGVITARGRNARQLCIASGPLLVAVGGLWLASLVGEPILLGRYLTSASPYFAMLLAECLLRLSRRRRIVAASVLAVGVMILFIAQRQPYAKVWKEDFGYIAATLRTEASPGDGFVMEPAGHPHDSARNAVSLFPASFEPLVDIAQPEPLPLTSLFTPDPPVTDLAGSESLPDRVWVVARNAEGGPYEDQLRALGWEPHEPLEGPGHTVTAWTRGS